MLKLYSISVLLLGVISRDTTKTRAENMMIYTDCIGACKSDYHMITSTTAPKDFIIGRSRSSSECDRYDVVPGKTIVNLASDGYIINPACSLNLIGFGVNDETFGFSGMCYEILEIDIPCGDRNIITIRAWPLLVYQNKTSIYVVVNDTVPLLKESFTCIYRRQHLDKYCFNGVTMYEISIQRTTDDPSIKHSLTIRTTVAIDPLYQEVNPRHLNEMFVISNECQCDGPVCEPCETETHRISTDFVESLLKNTTKDQEQTSSPSFDVNNLITVLGGILCAIVTSVTVVIVKRYRADKNTENNNIPEKANAEICKPPEIIPLVDRKKTDNLGTEEIPEGDEELSQALRSIVEAQNDQDNTGTVADGVNQPKAQISRFAQLDDDQKKKIVMESQSHATKRQPTDGVSIFRQWLKETKNYDKFEAFSIEQLDRHLGNFYVEVRNANGQMYSKNTFVAIRASISRHLRAHPFNKTFDLVTDKDFYKSNQKFLGMKQKIKRDGPDAIKHHPHITDEDFEKLRSSNILVTSNPQGLQRKVWFDIMIGFGSPEVEDQRSFTNRTFTVKTDDRGIKFVEMVASEITKNHRGELSDHNCETSPRIYANNTPVCPVSSFELYLSKRNPKSTHFFQMPIYKFQSSEDVWYAKRLIGKQTLRDMMKNISKGARLSKTYTNHSLSITPVDLLSHSGVPGRNMIRTTGSKCEAIANMNSYNADSSDNQ